MQLNELRLVSETEFNQWEATWDRTSRPPEEMLNYFVKVVWPARQAERTKIVDIFRNAENENK